jgi:hypothetical protein
LFVDAFFFLFKFDPLPLPADESNRTQMLINELVMPENYHVPTLEFEPTALVWSISDIHIDCSENFKWIQNIIPHPDDALIVAGDVCSKLETLRETLQGFKDKFRFIIRVDLETHPRANISSLFFLNIIDGICVPNLSHTFLYSSDFRHIQVRVLCSWKPRIVDKQIWAKLYGQILAGTDDEGGESDLI